MPATAGGAGIAQEKGNIYIFVEPAVAVSQTTCNVETKLSRILFVCRIPRRNYS